jgi:hypothetical protein
MSTNLVITVLVIVALGYCLYSSNIISRSCANVNDDENIDYDSLIEKYEETENESANGLVNETENETANEKSTDPINKWDSEFSVRDTDIKNVNPSLDDDEANFADFTTDGKNYNNNLTHFDSADLLPKADSENTKYPSDDGWSYKKGANWDESNPQIKEVEGNAWLNERKFMGITSTASSLRNANHDIRRDIPNPQMTVGPWNNTTILPDSNSKGLCTL